MNTNKIAIVVKSTLIVSVIAILSVASFAFSLDLVAKVAVTSFDALVKALPDKAPYDGEKGGWIINGLDGKERIVLSKNFAGKNPDIALEFDAAPFINAGLDVAKLPTGQYRYDKTSGKITMPFEYGKDKFGADAGKSALNAFKQLVKTHRDLISYHEILDHYGIALGNGNMFEWAKDMKTNDKDMVFVLNPKPLIDAGVDASKIQEWVFAKVPIKDESGKPVKVDKFLKPFNVK